MKHRVKVSFPIDGIGGIERMFAQQTDKGTFILDNSPFYAFDISYCDEFNADEDGDELVFRNVIARGGHSTYRIKLPKEKDHSHFLKYWLKLQSEGCSYEGSSANANRLYTIDIPTPASVDKVYTLMEKYEKEGIWEFEEGHYFQK